VIDTLTSPTPSSVTVIVSPASVSLTVSECPCVVMLAGGGVVALGFNPGKTLKPTEALNTRRGSSGSNRARYLFFDNSDPLRRFALIVKVSSKKAVVACPTTGELLGVNRLKRFQTDSGKGPTLARLSNKCAEAVQNCRHQADELRAKPQASRDIKRHI